MSKTMTIIFIGAIIAVLGGLVTAFGTYLHNKKSSEKTDRIEKGVNRNIDIGEMTSGEVRELRNRNTELGHKVDELLIKQTELKGQLQPFVEFAQKTYPNLSSERALDSLKEDIKKIEGKTFSLEKLEQTRQLREKELEALKNTPPSIEAVLSMDKQRNVSVGVQFLNNVPIKLSYTLEHSYRNKILSNHTTGGFQLYPIKDNRPIFIKDDFNFRDHIPNDGFSSLKISISYESIYYLESLNPSLIGTSIKMYTIDPYNNTLTIDK
jgi:hypothetical protein